MTIEATNLTNKEYYRLNGTLSEERIEALLEIDVNVDGSSPAAYIDEAMGTFPNEDFLEHIIKKVREVAKRVRGDNKDDLDQILLDLEDLQDKVNNDSDYGRSELENALGDINKVWG
jgi:hypothetical protein